MPIAHRVGQKLQVLQKYFLKNSWLNIEKEIYWKPYRLPLRLKSTGFFCYIQKKTPF